MSSLLCYSCLPLAAIQVPAYNDMKVLEEAAHIARTRLKFAIVPPCSVIKLHTAEEAAAEGKADPQQTESCVHGIKASPILCTYVKCNNTIFEDVTRNFRGVSPHTPQCAQQDPARDVKRRL